MPCTLPADLNALRLKRKPERDGEVLMYSYEDEMPARLLKYFDRRNLVLFVNGINTSPAGHEACANELSKYSNCRVIGVYNATYGAIADLAQCIEDIFTPDPQRLLRQKVPQYSSDPVTRRRQEEGHDRRVPQTPKRTVLTVNDIEQVLSRNLATISLFHLLRHAQTRTARLVAHSQGNFITSNALTAVKALDGSGSIQGREVWSYGSPNLTWPGEIIHRDFRNSFDPVSWLSDIRGGGFGRTTRFKLSGDFLSHDFLEYLQCEALHINHFRFGRGVKRDNELLAYELAGMGTNFRYVNKVLERLERHKPDGAEVACYYVESLTDPMLRDMKADWPHVVTRLKNMLTQAPSGRSRYGDCVNRL